MTRAPDTSHRRPIRLWLYAVAALMVATVVVGGATRLAEWAFRSSNGSR